MEIKINLNEYESIDDVTPINIASALSKMIIKDPAIWNSNYWIYEISQHLKIIYESMERDEHIGVEELDG